MPAYLWEKIEENKVLCQLCHHSCRIKSGHRGICQVRENRSGVLESLVYERLIASNPDPIEKKPLFHVLPGSLSYSIATVGCNFRCRFCQNADIAQMPADSAGTITGETISVEQVVANAKTSNCASISYTYTEPTIYFEMAYDTAKLAHDEGLLNIFVTNGYMTSKAIEMIQPYLNAANVDLKAFQNESYKTCCNAKLEPVKETLKQMKAAGIWVEITTLIIPGLNDNPSELRAIAEFIIAELGPETPWHVSRFHPTYRMTDRNATPVSTILNARQIGLETGLKFVYSGNVAGHGGEETLCPQCGQTVIGRQGFRLTEKHIENGACNRCGTHIAGIGI
jgi:pyruvate formate lyase activating enzyme